MTSANDTIAAVASACGQSAISIVRLSGADSLSIACQICKKNELPPRYAALRFLYDSELKPVDKAIVIYFKAPNSYTGEDIVEFQCHGGYGAASFALDECVRLGARLAEPGEFSKRAFLSGKMSFEESEAVLLATSASNSSSLKFLAAQMKGGLQEYADKVRSELLSLLAFSEVNIDYAEEDLPQDLLGQMAHKAEGLQKSLLSLANSSERRKNIFGGFKVCIIGKPNVGKSSILNSLLNYERSIVSHHAGTTRDTVEESITIGRHTVRLVDTAGIREAKDEIERIGIDYSYRAAKEADIVVAVFDGSREFDTEDEAIFGLLETNSKPTVVVLNKSDLPQELDSEQLFGFELLRLCGLGGYQELIEKLSHILDSMFGEEELMLVNKRQTDAVRRCAEAIEGGLAPLSLGELELFSFHINEALTALNLLTKPFINDEMLDEMFGSFCLGK